MTDEIKTIGLSYLTDGKLGNHNAGEGGSQTSTLKKYGNKPYISGQSLRHAVKDYIKSQEPNKINCASEDSCGDIENCIICDLGYMNTDLDPSENFPTSRQSPLRMTPSVGVYDTPITTDMIVQFGVGGSVKKEEGSDESHGNSIAYRELTENVYSGAWTLDSYMVGRRESEAMYHDNEIGNRYERTIDNKISESERINRINLIIDALQHYSKLAGQSRHMSDFMPDLAICTRQPTYNQRISNALHVNSESKKLNIKALESVCKDIVNQDGEIYVSGTYNPNVITNWEEVFEMLESIDGVKVLDTVSECYDELKYDQ